MSHGWRCLAICLTIGVASRARAQRGAISGTVLRGSTEKPLAETEISIASIDRRTRSNYLGEFRLDRLAAGAYLVTLRHIGFATRTDTINVRDGEVVDREYALTEAPVSLDAQKTVTSSATPPSPNLQEFNERVKVGFGHFITEDQLRKFGDGGHNFVDFVKARLPGMKVVIGDYGEQWLVSGRKQCSTPAFLCGGMAPCYVSIYIDGVANYVSGVTPDTPTDFTSLRSEDFAAIEYYASGATAPSKYNQTGSDCGILLLWRRYHVS